MSGPQETAAGGAPPRYIVGIDLGTTNSAAAYADTADAAPAVQTFAVPQLVAPGVVEARETLPSFHYQRGADELAAGALRLPWSRQDSDYCVGTFARDHGALVPGRLITSAKSWLCHAGVDRLAELLPWHGAADVERLSPVEVSARYLAHIRAAWNHRFPEHPLEAQDVVLTLPASFDEVARELTVKAAARAGLPRVVLIEEPQAAFYAWIDAQGPDWERAVAPGEKILICDVGGGTSDFTLIHVRRQADGKVQFHRVAVGEHLILGGDNLDLALAHHVERKLAGDARLAPRPWAVLVQSCRQAKETLLGASPPDTLTLNLPGAGSRVIGGGVQVELTRDEVQRVLVDGFLPRVRLDERPQARRSGFQEFGLPYAPDAAITRYLAAFLTAHRPLMAKVLADGAPAGGAADPARPDIILCNGGLFASPALCERLLEVVGSWFSPPGEPAWRPRVLENRRLDLAVARGAAYYGLVRRGVGVRIAAGLARAYFVGVAHDGGAPQAVCLLPAGVEEGQGVDLVQRRFNLLIRQPVEFALYVSSTRLTDRPGELVAVDPEQMTPLPPIRTVLQAGKKTAVADTIPVNLHARLTEIGTLELWCGEAEGPRTWKLQFDIRAATRTDLAAHAGAGEQAGIVDAGLAQACQQVIERTFGSGPHRDKPDGLMKRLAEAADMPRQNWPPSLLRALWEKLVELADGRRQSAAHEARWLNLLGFALRPGYGLALDDWRVEQTWRLVQGKMVFAGSAARAEWWILWRRLAGGLLAGQQRALAEPLLAELRAQKRALEKGRGGDFRLGSHEAAEVWRMLGSLELLPLGWKHELGRIALDLAAREKTDSVRAAEIWAVGRLASRVPLYGPLNGVLAPDTAAEWAPRIMALKRPAATAPLALMQLARRTADRYRDLDDQARRQILAWLAAEHAPPHFIQLVEEGGSLAEEEQGLVFGESLPMGLRLA